MNYDAVGQTVSYIFKKWDVWNEILVQRIRL